MGSRDDALCWMNEMIPKIRPKCMDMLKSEKKSDVMFIIDARGRKENPRISAFFKAESYECLCTSLVFSFDLPAAYVVEHLPPATYDRLRHVSTSSRKIGLVLWGNPRNELPIRGDFVKVKDEVHIVAAARNDNCLLRSPGGVLTRSRRSQIEWRPNVRMYSICLDVKSA